MIGAGVAAWTAAMVAMAGDAKKKEIAVAKVTETEPTREEYARRVAFARGLIREALSQLDEQPPKPSVNFSVWHALERAVRMLETGESR